MYVCIIQQMTINLFGWENAFAQPESDPDFEAETKALDIPIHAVDIIIADEYAPIFERKGGLSRARALFNADLERLIEELNYEVAA